MLEAGSLVLDLLCHRSLGQQGCSYSFSARSLSPARSLLPGEDATDWSRNVHVSRVLFMAQGPRPYPRSLLGVAGKAEGALT